MLTTEFIKVAQSGPTIDGREIDAQDLRDIAETYDPAKYEAVIWPEHERFYGNHGTVVAVEARENGELVELFVKFRPGWRFLEKNREGQKLYASIEIWPDFAATGKAYLAGIAITDNPASLGTEQIRLFTAHRKAKQEAPGSFYAGVQLPHLFAMNPAELTEESAQEALSLLQRIVGLFRRDTSPQPDEEDSMTEEQHKQLLSAMADNTKAVTAMAEMFAAAPQPKPESKQGTAPDANGADDTLSAGTDFAAALKPLVDGQDALAKQFAAMAERFEGKAPGTDVPENANPADSAGCI